MRDIVQKTTQKTTYKDYQSYLQSYKNGNSSGSLSQTSSTSSLQSTENERIQHDFQKNYIENNNNKFTGVGINDKKKEEVKKPTMKSELFITINQPIEETFQHEQKTTTTSSTNRFSEIKQRFNGGTSNTSNKVNNQNFKIQHTHQNNQNANIQCTNQKSPISPKSAENNVVSDRMIYAKTAVLEELLTTSPSLKKVPPTFPMEAPKNFNSAPKPPPLPTSKPPSVSPPSLPATKPPSLPATKPPNLPTTKPPNLPTTKPHIAPKINQHVDNQNLSPEQLLKELQALMIMQEKANSMVTEQPNPTTVVPVAEGVSDVDKGDPNVKTLVYNTYRGMLGGYNNKANNLVSSLPRNAVVQDQGVARQVESMAAQGQPAVARQPSDRRVEPPLCVQNAMLTKDKKPFTYTPGGIDLSEIGSPRLARRIERNANAPGVGEVHTSSPPRGFTGTMPPAALAAMQPALQVQVFPSGPPPPPPPPPVHIPPPPPMGPLPTKSISTNDGVVERPDMTKIIPENPMALLRKTPKAATSMADNINYVQPPPQHNQSNFANAVIQNKPQPVQPQNQYQPQVIQRQEPQVAPPAPKPQMVQRPAPQPQPQQQPQPEMKTSTAQLGSLYIPPIDNPNKPVPQTPQTPRNVSSPPAPPQRSPQSPSSPQSPMATLQKSPRPWQNQKPAQQEPAWVQRSQSPPQAPQRDSPPAQSPPYQRGPQTPTVQRGPPQSPNVQSNVIGRVIIPMQMDGSPQSTNVEAVFVTQPIVLQHPGPGNQQQRAPQQKQQQQQLQQQQLQQQQLKQQQLQQQQLQQQQLQQQQLQQQQLQQQQLQQQQLQQQQQQKQQQQQQRVQQQQTTQQRTEQKTIRIIPIQIEGSTNNNGNNNVQRQESSRFNSGATTPATATPGSARPFNRQPSWSQSGPTQSNAFKLIQKITNTDGDDDEDEEEVEHEPRNSQQFQQPPAEQVRKMKMTDDDRGLMNKVKQGLDNELFLHNEPDPRYRGAAIPSKAFRLLQWMIDDLPSNMTTVPRNGQNSGSNNANQVRMIPVQMEGETSGNYVPPSEQTVQEPKKYTGGKIPSRSFKILQAMTGDTCANETDPDPSCYGYPPIPPYIPPPIPPYWHNYWGYSPCPTPCDVSRTDSPNTTKCATPTPFMRNRRPKDESDTDNERSERRRSFPLGFRGCSPQTVQRNEEVRGRSTPVQFRGCSPQACRRNKEDGDRNRRSTSLPRTPPCWGYPYYPYVESEPETDTEGNGRATPMNYWGGYSPFYPIPYSEYETDTEEKPRNGRTTPKVWDNDRREENYPPYPMYDPYYPPYYYYPMYPYPVYPPAPCDSDEFMGYSSTDEMNGYSKNYKTGDFKQEAPKQTPPKPEGLKPRPPKEEEQKPTPPKHEEQSNPQKQVEVNNYEEDAIDVSKFKDEINSNTTKITIEYPETDTTDNSDYSDTDTEVEDTEENKYSSSNMSMGSLKAIRSVSDINVYSVDESNCSDEESEHLTEDEEASVEEMPHQLSVIYEESERSDLSRIRESSVASNDSAETIACGYQDLLHEEQNMFNENEENQKISLMNDENTRRDDEDTHEEDKQCIQTNVDEVIETNNNNDEWDDEEDHDWWGELKSDDEVIPAKNKNLFGSADDGATQDEDEEPLMKLPKEELLTSHTAVEETVTQEDAQSDDVDFWSEIDTVPEKSKDVLVDVEKKLNLKQYAEPHKQEYISSKISLSSSTAAMSAQIEEISYVEESVVHTGEESSVKYAEETSIIEAGPYGQKDDQSVKNEESQSVKSDLSLVQYSYNSPSEKATLSSNSSYSMETHQIEKHSSQEETSSSKPQLKSSSTDLEETLAISSNSISMAANQIENNSVQEGAISSKTQVKSSSTDLKQTVTISSNSSSSITTELNQSTPSILEDTVSSKIQTFTSGAAVNVTASSTSSSTSTKSTQSTGKNSSVHEETTSLKIKTKSLDLEDQTEESSTDSSSKSTVCSSPSDENVEEEQVRMPSIKERIAALKKSVANKNKVKEEREIKGNVKEKITVLEEYQNRLLDEEIEIKSEENRRRSVIYERNNSQHEEDIVAESIAVVKEIKSEDVLMEAREVKQEAIEVKREAREVKQEAREVKQEAREVKQSITVEVSKIQEDLLSRIEENLITKIEESLLSKFEEDNKRKVEDKSTTEENSEDEIDSGVTSDVSRHISDNEEVHEIRKMTKYQRAATHSRLFKLLQDECDNDEDEEVVPPKKETTIQNKKENLSLPLTKGYDSCDSSGINSPMSPVVNDRLVKELVQSLLSRKKGRIFRGMPVEKLHNAAFKILQEELQMNHFNPEEVISPLRSFDSTPAQTPQEYYSEYNQYCDYWNSYEDYDVMPSKTFKLIQEHSTSNKTGSISGFLARCPRVLSSKNLYKDLISVLETRNSPDSAHPRPFEAQNGAS